MIRQVASCLVALLPLFVASGCDAKPSPSFDIADVAFPVRKELNAYPAALVDGRLELVGRCLMVATPDDRWVILWPPGLAPVMLVGPSVGVASIATGQVLASIGARIRLGGGEIKSDSFAQELTQSDIEPECVRGSYWLSSDLNPRTAP